MRIGHSVTFDEPTFQGMTVPRRTMRARKQWVLQFAAGLPLSIGQKYAWRVRIDGDTNDRWIEEFFVPGPAPGVVLG